MEEIGTMFFQIEVNLICTFLHVNFIYAFICILAVNHTRFCMYICLFLLSYYPTICPTSHLFVCLCYCDLSPSMISDCDKVYLALSAISKTISAKLLKKILGHFSNFVVCQSFSRFVCIF